MISSTALFLLSLPLAFAQYGGSPPESSPSSTAAPAPSTTGSSSTSIQTVTVGENGQLGFSPNTLTAAVGSQVEFIFFPPTHSVVQASFAKPCQPINDTGFYSGPFNTASASNSNSFIITVNNTSPIWFYCGFPGHCEAGMVGAINVPSDGSKTLDQFKAAAAKVSSTTPPTFGAQGGIIGPVEAASNGASTTSPAPASTSKPGSASELKGSMLWASLLVTAVTAWGIAELMA